MNWDIDFESGNNEIIANGFENGNLVTSDTLMVKYSYTENMKPKRFKLTSTRLSNGNHLVVAIAVDKDGRRCLDYNKRIYFSLEGKGKLIQNYGVPGKSSIIEMANGKASIEVKTVPFEKATIEARNQDFKGDYLVLSKL